VIVGYPRHKQQITDIVTMDAQIFDLSDRLSGYASFLYDIAPFDWLNPSPVLVKLRSAAAAGLGNVEPKYKPDFRVTSCRPCNAPAITRT
jgi:hypothetical protein